MNQQFPVAMPPGAQPPNVYVAPYGYQNHPGYGPSFEVEEESVIDLLKIIWLLLHYRWLIAGFLIVGFLCGLMFTWVQTPMYRGEAKLEVNTGSAKIIQDLELLTQSSDLRAYETARQKLLSRDLARRVTYALNLSEDPKYLAPVASFSLSNVVKKAFSLGNSEAIFDLNPEQRTSITTARVQKSIDAQLIRNTSIINVSAVHPSPEYAAKIANQAVQSYISQSADNLGETSDLTRQFLQEQVIEVKKKLEISEQELLDYAKSADITITGEDGSLISQNVSRINESLSKAIEDRLAAERDFKQTEQSGAASLEKVYQSESVRETRTKITDLKASYQEKLATLKPAFPEMRRLAAQINELQKQLNAEITSIGEGTKIAFEQSLKREQALKDELKKLESEQSQFQDKNVRYTILKREVESNRTQYGSLVSKLNEIGIGSELQNSNAKIIDNAIVPLKPYAPRLLIMVAASLALFAAAAAALIYILELLNNTFSLPEQVESELGLSVLGIVPKVDPSEWDANLANSTSAINEAYRTLRTSLQFSGTEGDVMSILVTSSEPSEGKSTTVYKLACDFAALGKRVIIVDGDLRKPRMHRLFNMDNTIGLSNLLTNVTGGPQKIIEMFRKTDIENVSLLTAGTIPPNPTDLLMSEKMSLTIHLLKKKYDLVLIDSAPVMGLADAPILSRNVDGTLLVVSTQQVTRKAAKAAVARLKSASGNVIGAALTKFSVNSAENNYAYRYLNYNYYTYQTDPALLENLNKNESNKPSSWINTLFGRFSLGAGQRAK